MTNMATSLWIMFSDGTFRYLRKTSRLISPATMDGFRVQYRPRVNSISYEQVYYGETKSACIHRQYLDSTMRSQ